MKRISRGNFKRVKIFREDLVGIHMAKPDSPAHEVVGHDLYAGMIEIKDEFDFSEYPKDIRKI